MKLVSIYLNPWAYLGDQSDLAHTIFIRVIGIPSSVNFSKICYGPRHSFDDMQGHAKFLGQVLAPGDSHFAQGMGRKILMVETPRGLIALSAADVAEQATVGGCGLGWATEVPDSWIDVRKAPPRRGDIA